MYGEANYGPPFGQGQTPMPPANQQCPPPPFHFHFQQGSPAAPAPLNVVQQAIYAGPPPIGQQGPYLYQHGFFAPPPPAHQSSSVPFSGMPNTGQSYGHPTLPVHGSTWHNMQHSSTAGNRNFQWIHPPALVTPHAPPYPCMSQPAVPHGALPPSNNTTSGCAAQGPTCCRALCPAQPQAGLQRNPPPPPASNFVNPTSFGTSRHLTAGASLMASLTLLPAATMPTAPSPSTSLPKLNASSFPGHPDIDHRSNKLLWTEMRPSDVEMEDPLIRIFSADCGFLIAITNSKRPQSHGKLSLSQKKKKKKKGCTTSETNDTSCEIPSLQPQLVRLSDQQALQPLREKITTITDLCPKSYVELSLSQKKKQKKRKKKKKGCKTPETNNKSCESPSIQPHLVQVTDQEVEMPRDLSFSVKNKKRNGKKSRKPHDCNNEVCDVSVGTSVMESNMPAVDPYIQPSIEISLEQLVAEPVVEAMSTTSNSKSPKPNADFGCPQETKKKKQKRNHKTNENKELSVETMMPEADPSFQPSLAMFSEQELDVSKPLNVDAEPLVDGMSRTINSEKPRPNADFNCSQETKKKKRKREVLMEPMMPEAESSLKPSLTMLSEHVLEVVQPRSADAEPLVEGMSTTINSESSPKCNVDISCSQEMKKKNPKRKRNSCENIELLVEIMTPEADPSLQPPLAIFSEQEVEVTHPLNTDAQPLAEGVSRTSSESPKPNAEFSCSLEMKEKNPKRKRKTNENKELLVEIMMPEADPSLQPQLAKFSEQNVKVAQPLNTVTEWQDTKFDEVPSLSHLAPKADTEVVAISRDGSLLQMANSSPERCLLKCSQKKLHILDIIGLLADIVEGSIPSSFKPDKIISRKAVFKRPFCDDFIQFCFDRFDVGVWSSRIKCSFGGFQTQITLLLGKDLVILHIRLCVIR